MDNPNAVFTLRMLKEKIKDLPDDLLVGAEIFEGCAVEIHGVDVEIREYDPWYESKYSGRKVLVIS